MYRISDEALRRAAVGSILQAASDYHEWKQAELRNWMTRPRKRKDIVIEPRPMELSQRNAVERWGRDAEDWFGGADYGGLRFADVAEALGFEPTKLAAGVMRAEFWRYIKISSADIWDSGTGEITAALKDVA